MAKKKAAAKKAKAPKKSSKEMLVVTSKVKAYIKGKGRMSASDTAGALNECVYAILDAACKRTESNRRSTVKPQDL
jgi:histone H3/H4